MADVKSSLNKLASVAAELDFYPSQAHINLKVAFYSRAADNPGVDLDNITSASVQQVLGDSRISNYWAIPGFSEWFCNRNELKEKMTSLFYKALDSLDDIFASTDPKSAPTKVALLKALAEMTGNNGGKQQAAKLIDGDLAKKSREELEQMIESDVERRVQLRLAAAKESAE
jgi:hypothetical protein